MVNAAELAILVKAKDESSATLDKISGKAGGMGTAFKGLAIAGVSLAAVGAVALKLGADFDAAYDKIRVGTGATGDALEGLQDDFKSVFKSVPTDMGSASTAIADLNTRLGLTGKPLQDLSRQFLELSRITGADLGTNITTVTRAFGDWSIATEDQAATLDTLFRVSQATGPSVDALAAKVVQFGAPMRQMGFSFEETAVLMGQFEKQGVNTELVMGSLRIAIGKFAKDGIPMRKGLEDTIKKIQELGPSAESTALAMETFGARAGADMADTILSGKFAIDEWVDSIAASDETIMKAGQATMDWNDRLKILYNKGLVLIEPAVTAVFNAVDKLVSFIETTAGPAIYNLVKGPIGAVIGAIRGFASDVALAIGVFRSAFNDPDITSSGWAGQVEKLAVFVRLSLLPALQDIGAFLRDKVLPQMVEFGAVALGLAQGVLTSIVIPALVTLKQGWADLLPILAKAGKFLLDHKEVTIGVAAAILLLTNPWLAVAAVLVVVLAKWDEIKAMLTVTIPNAIQSAIHAVEGIPVIGEIFKTTLANVKAVVEFTFNFIRAHVELAMNSVRAVIQVVTALIHGDWSAAWDGVRDLVSGFFEFLKGIFSLELGLAKDILWSRLTGFVGVVSDAVPLMLAGGKALLSALWDGISEIWSGAVWPFFTGLPGMILGAVGGLLGLLLQAGRDLLAGLWNGVKDGWTDVLVFFTGLPSKIFLALPNMANLLWDIGRQIMESLLSGLKAGWDAVAGFVSGIAGKIKGLKGPIEEDRRLLIEEGQAIMDGLRDGLASRMLDLERQLLAITEQISTQLNPERTRYLQESRQALMRQMLSLMAEAETVAATAAPLVGAAIGQGVGRGVGSMTLTYKDTGQRLVQAFVQGMTSADAMKALQDGNDTLAMQILSGLARLGMEAVAKAAAIGGAIASGLSPAAANLALQALPVEPAPSPTGRPAGRELIRAAEWTLATGGLGFFGGLPPLGFASGGIVPGPAGMPQLAVVHGGEEVRTPAQQGNGSISIHFNAPVYGLLDFEDKIKRTVREAARGGAFRGVLATVD